VRFIGKNEEEKRLTADNKNRENKRVGTADKRRCSQMIRGRKVRDF
jgi:hypothetical protein